MNFIFRKVAETKDNFIQGLKLFIAGFGQRDRYLTEFVAACVSFIAGVLASVSPTVVSTRVSMNGFTQMFMPELWITVVAVPGLIVVSKNWWYRRLDEDHDFAPVAVMSGYLVLSALSLIFDFENWVFWTLTFLMLGVTQGYALSREWTDLRWGVAVVGTFCWISLTVNVLINTPMPWPIAMAAYIGIAMCNFLTSSRLSAVRRQVNKAREAAWDASA